MLSAEVVLARLDDEHPRVREHAVRLAENVLRESPSVRSKLYEMVRDEDPTVRYQLAFTLGEIRGAQATAALAAIARRDAANRWVRLAVLSSSLGRAGELVALLAADSKWSSTGTGLAFLEQLAEQAGLQNQNDQVAEVLSTLEGFHDDEKKLAQTVVRGLSKGLAKAGNPLRGQLASGSKAGQLLAEMVERSKAVAADRDRPVDQRTEAVLSLGLAPFEQTGDLLARLLDSRQPQEVQIAALRALDRFRDDQVAEIIVKAWLGFSPAVRGEAAEAVFARPERLAILLKAIERRQIQTSQLDPARIQFLLTHPREKIRREASRLLGTAKLAPRKKVVADWRDVLAMKGDVTRGKAVFKRDCSKCHRLEGVGVELGLPLNAIGNRGPETILLNVLDPNREVNPQYLNYIVLTDDGLQKTGMITAETATSITLRRAEGVSDTILRTDIDELQNTGLSIMPEGQEKLMTKQELADVIGYLMSIR